MNLLRFFTAGSIDDGKSTLIGRLLYDSGNLLKDQINSVSENGKINLALVTDGLKAEREQGITIDVAYRYFSTKNRKFIIADCPGHAEYTRNMITACSSSSFAVLLIDARNGVTEQTKRHAYISSLMGIKDIAVCINKIDLVNYSEEVFLTIQKDLSSFLKQLNFNHVHYIPISALNGDNIVTPSKKIKWNNSLTLLQILENTEEKVEKLPSRFAVQNIVRPHKEEFHDFRGIAGFVNSGNFKKGDNVTLIPQQEKTKIKKIFNGNEEIEIANSQKAITILLEKEIDISRGDMIVKENEIPKNSNHFQAVICFMDKSILNTGKKYVLQHNTNSLRVIVQEIFYRINIHNLEKEQCDSFSLNDIGKIALKTSKKIFYDTYNKNKYNGNFILIDEVTNNTVAAGIIVQ